MLGRYSKIQNFETISSVLNKSKLELSHIVPRYKAITYQSKFEFNQTPNMTLAIFYLSIILTALLNHVSPSCLKNNTVVGCTQCSPGQFIIYNMSSNLQTCHTDKQCITIVSDTCIQCQPNFLLNSDGNCIQSNGCLKLVSSSNILCEQCLDNFYLSADNECQPREIPYCQTYDNITNQCLFCQYPFMEPNLKCEMQTQKCLNFDEEVWKCKSCKEDLDVDSSGYTCVKKIEGCMIYNQSTTNCIYCEEKYYLDTEYSCTIKGTIGQQTYAQNNQITYQTICLRRDRVYDPAQLSCSSFPQVQSTHCQTLEDGGEKCKTCLPGYYLENSSSTKCLECAVAIQNCKVCSSDKICLFCDRGYYLLSSFLTDDRKSRCLSCASYGCLQCYAVSLDSSLESLEVRCLSCIQSSTLYQGTCYQCKQENHSYSIQSSKCQNCSVIKNCQYCRITQRELLKETQCKWCINTHYYNKQNRTCILITNQTKPNFETAYQILSKSSPGIQQQLLNNGPQLMSACQSTNGFICECLETDLSSICEPLLWNIDVSDLNTTTSSDFRRYSKQMRMAAEFSSFTFDQINITDEILMTTQQYSNLLSIYTFLLIKGSPKEIVSHLFNHLSASMRSVFSQQQPTILTGNGFYYKYVPKGIPDTNLEFIQTTIDTSKFELLVFVWFDRVPDDFALTGHIYVFSETSSDINVTILKNGYLTNSKSFTLKVNDIEQANNISLSNGFLFIEKFEVSIPEAKGYQVFSNLENVTDPYRTERIQYIFYSQSFLYILFFMLLYLIFLPLCSMVDCCKEINIHNRKVNHSEEQFQKSQESNVQIKINYREFFPIYNVANTPRPYRLLKLCLLIVNLQHGITFLTLIYFNLPSELEVAAIALAIPAYLCTVVAGYICGFIFRVLPEKFKALITVVGVGYWVLWVFLMRQFQSNEYKLFVLVFAIIFFLIDMVIDSLETLLVYFAIRQGQLSMFQCLAKWLSLRGFYEFDKLAKQLKDDDD